MVLASKTFALSAYANAMHSGQKPGSSVTG